MSCYGLVQVNCLLRPGLICSVSRSSTESASHPTSVPRRMLFYALAWTSISTSSPLAWCPTHRSLASMHRRYKMPPATTSPGQALFLVYQHIRKISICAQANFHSQKPRVGLCMIFMIGFLGRLALPAKVHPKPFAGVPQHCGCLNLSQQGILE